MKTIAILMTCLLVTGCAWSTAVEVKEGERARGFPFYGVKPLLKVSGNTVEVVVVPNTSKRYAARFGSFLAKNKIEAKFSGGFVTSFTSDQDSTQVAVKFLEIVQGLGKAAIENLDKFKGLSGKDPAFRSFSGNDVRLYDIRFDERGNVSLHPLLNLDGQPLVSSGEVKRVVKGKDPFESKK